MRSPALPEPNPRPRTAPIRTPEQSGSVRRQDSVEEDSLEVCASESVEFLGHDRVDDPPAVQHLDAVGDTRELIEMVPGHQHRAAAPGHLPQQIPESDDGERVQSVGRLVEDDDVRLMSQCSHQPHLLARSQ